MIFFKFRLIRVFSLLLVVFSFYFIYLLAHRCPRLALWVVCVQTRWTACHGLLFIACAACCFNHDLRLDCQLIEQGMYLRYTTLFWCVQFAFNCLHVWCLLTYAYIVCSQRPCSWFGNVLFIDMWVIALEIMLYCYIFPMIVQRFFACAVILIRLITAGHSWSLDRYDTQCRSIIANSLHNGQELNCRL